jgi:DNA-binding GntR family transcriptional regulator
VPAAQEEAQTRVEIAEPLARTPLHARIAERVRDMIVEGQLEPGSRIPEKELCARFGVSRTPLREALKVLAWEGLLELNPNRGATVTAVRLDELQHVFEVLAALESLAGELACAQIDEVELAEIRALHYRMVLAYHRGERHDYFQLNQEIHSKILEAARNPVLSDTYRTLSARARRVRYMANLTPERWRSAVAEHEEILGALADRDGHRLAQILRAHIRAKFEAVRDSL